MNNLFVFNGPLQYFLSRLIIKSFQFSNVIGVQYVDNGDFSDVFEEIDRALVVDKIDVVKYRLGDFIDIGNIDRAFFSNRFNSSEIELYLRLKRRINIFCGYEDGLALYLPHCYFDSSLSESNKIVVLKNLIKESVYGLGFRGWRRPRFFNGTVFEEFYSIFDDIPVAKNSAKKFSLMPALRSLSVDEDGSGVGGALLLSQSLVKDGWVGEATYLEFLGDIAKDLSQRYERIYFKPHPRDSSSLLTKVLKGGGFELLPECYRRIPVELFLAKYRSIVPYGFWSSSLAYAGGGLGAEAYSLGAKFVGCIDPDPTVLSAWSSAKTVLEKYGVTVIR